MNIPQTPTISNDLSPNNLTPTIDTLYNDRRIGDMFYNVTAQTIDISEITYQGNKFKPEKQKRTITMFYSDFLQFDKHVRDTVTTFKEWMTPLVTKFQIRGGWAMPKSITDLIILSGQQLDSYARWFLILDNGWTMCSLFTSNNGMVDLTSGATETHYTGECTMDVEFYFIETILVLHWIAN